MYLAHHELESVYIIIIIISQSISVAGPQGCFKFQQQLTIAPTFCQCFLPAHVFRPLSRGYLFCPFHRCFVKDYSNADTQRRVK